MKSILTLIFALYFIHAYGDEIYFTMDPALSPDGETIIFSYNSDLWTVPSKGGLATQITALDGSETRPLYSPDGKWIAFTGTQYGNKDIFIMPVGGGEIRQLTFHSAFDDLDSWSWDSRKLYFSSNRENRISGYEMSIDGSTPKRLYGHYFNTVHNIVPHPKSNEIFFNESWESKNFAHRKRYKGDYNPDVKSYDPVADKYKEYTTYEGKDFGVTIDQNGKIYFMSDEKNGEYNLYTFENNQKKSLTDFSTSIYWPKVSANGEKVVFRKDYKIFIYDVRTGKTWMPEINLFRNSIIQKKDEYDVKGNISDFDVSPDQKKLAFISRGKLFVSDVEGKFIMELSTKSDEAVGEVHWLADNKTLLYTRTIGGYYNWFSQKADGSSEEKAHTADLQNNRLLTFDSGHKRGVYFSGRNEVRMINLETLESTLVVEDELWGFYNSPPKFSPDDEYIMYSAYRNFEQDIFLYHIENRSLTNMTNTLVTENNPVWSPEGKYIYFTSNLTQPSYPYGQRDFHIYQMALDKYEDPFKISRFEELFVEEEKKEGQKEDSEKDKKEEKEEKISVSIEADGAMERINRIGPSFGSQSSPYVVQDNGKTIILYTSDHDEGERTLWKTTLEEFETPKTEKIGKSNLFGFQIKEADGKYWILAGGDIFTLDAAGGKMDKLEISHTFSKAMKDEFHQMFYESWAGMEQNFYDENFHGQDWPKLRDQYAAFLPYIHKRSDLRLIINDMLGELNTSHFGFYSSGKEENTFHGYRTLGTGIEWDDNNPYVVKRIITDGPADYKGKNILPGDRLISIDGNEVDFTTNREYYFSMPYMKNEIKLEFQRGENKHIVLIRPVSTSIITNLRYDEWQDSNQSYVDQKSDQRIAYLHMKNMGRGELSQFKQDIVREAQYRDGLIVDLRYNTGGNVHDEVLQWLSRKHYLNWKYREGELTPQPNFTPSSKPIVLLINEQSLSDAEMTANGFKELGLGTIIGTETYRWIIFTTGSGLVDGFYRLPSWGCYALDGTNLEKSGVKPDIRVDKNFVQRLKGQYPQLDKAIEVVLQQL